MKRLLSMLPVLVLAVSAAVAADPVAFEDGFEGVALDPFWTVQQTSGTIALSAAQAHGGSQAAQFARTADGQLTLSLSHTFEAAQFGTVSVWFYDTVFHCYASVVLENTALGRTVASWGVQDWDYDKYYFSAYSGSGTRAPRTVGWHLITISSTSGGQNLYLDGVQLHSGGNDGTGFNKISLNASGPWGYGSYFYDDFSFRSYALPTILQSPQSVMVVPGSNTTFSVTATGQAPLTHQWQFSGTNLAGATESMLTVTNAGSGTVGDYRVIVANGSGSVTSSVAALRLLLPPTVTTAAAGGITSFGATVNGAVNPNGAHATAFFEWGPTAAYGNATPVQALGDGTNTVTVNAALTGLAPVTTYHYRLVASNSAYRTEGSDATLTTTPAAPEISTHPQSQLVPQGSTATFTVVASGPGTITYQWQHNATNLVGRTLADLVLTNVQPGAAGPYRVIVANVYGSATSGVATLTVQVPPTAVTAVAGGITATRAVLNGSANPNGTAATAFFEWGTTAGYGNVTPAQAVGSGSGGVAVSAAISNLTHLTTYHYRLVVTNSAFRSNGGDTVFATLPARPGVTSFSPVVGATGTVVIVSGTNLTGATYVGFNGVSAVFTVLSDTQISAVVPAGAAYGRIVVAGPGGVGSSAGSFVVRPADAALAGPFWPPPLGCDFSESYSAEEAPIGRTGGKTWYFYNVALANTAVVYWGATNRGVRLSFVRSPFPEPAYASEVLSYASALSDLPGGVAVWTGQTRLPPSMALVYTRFTLRIKDVANNPLPLMNAAALGLDSSVGGVLVVTPALMFQANMLFEASLSASGPFTPALEFYDAQPTPAGGGTAYTSLAAGFSYENTRPFFTSGPFADTAVNMNTPTGPIAFTFTDAETGPASISVMPCVSSNQTLVPNGNLPVTRTAADAAYLRAYPLGGQTGKTLVTVSVTDGKLASSQSFVLTINSPPTLSDIPDHVAQKNQAGGPWSFTVGDSDSAPDSLVVSAVSGNALLVPDANIVLGGSGANRTITVTPTAGQTGTAVITVTVSDGMAQVSDTFTLKVNNPPVLTRNDWLFTEQGAEAPISDTLLAATDTESPASQLIYTVAFGGQGAPPHNGWLRLNATNLSAGGTFSQEDLEQGRVTYLHDGGCSTTDDFTFNVSDADGGVTPTGQYTTYTFRISISPVNHPPVAGNGSADVGLGATVLGSFSAMDTDCPPVALAFRVLTNAAKGHLTLTDATTGAFQYTARSGEVGQDTVVFQVSDGEFDAVAPGVFTFSIANQPPVAAPGSAVTREDAPVDGVLAASDPDLPLQALTYRLVAGALKGTVSIINTNTGAFRYQPAAGAIGSDGFSFVAHDGSIDSAPAAFSIAIRPNLDPGDVLISDSTGKRVVLVDGGGAQAVLSENGLLLGPKGIALAPSGVIAVMDEAGVVRIDPADGAQTLLAGATNFTVAPLGPVGIAFARDGAVLVADGVEGIKRVDPTNGTVSVVASGGSLVLPEGLAVATNGDIYVADMAAFAGQQSRIIRVNPTNGMQTVVSLGGNLVAPVGIALDNSGAVLVSDAATFGGAPYDAIIRIDPVSGAQTVVATNTLLAMPTGLAVASGGRVLTANQGNGAVVQVQVGSGEQAVWASGGYLVQPFGVAVVRRVILRSLAMLPDGRFRFQVFGEPDETYLVEYSPDLEHWEAAGSVSNATGLLDFVDPDSAGEPRRFYRARSQ